MEKQGALAQWLEGDGQSNACVIPTQLCLAKAWPWASPPTSLGLMSFIACFGKVWRIPLDRIYVYVFHTHTHTHTHTHIYIKLGYVGPFGIEGGIPYMYTYVCMCTLLVHTHTHTILFLWRTLMHIIYMCVFCVCVYALYVYAHSWILYCLYVSILSISCIYLSSIKRRFPMMNWLT